MYGSPEAQQVPPMTALCALLETVIVPGLATSSSLDPDIVSNCGPAPVPISKLGSTAASNCSPWWVTGTVSDPDPVLGLDVALDIDLAVDTSREASRGESSAPATVARASSFPATDAGAR